MQFERIVQRLLAVILAISMTIASVANAYAAPPITQHIKASAVRFRIVEARFISPDTMDPTLPGVGTNRYAYSDNDPINKSDPNGHIAIGIGVAIGALLGWLGSSKPANAPSDSSKAEHMSDAESLRNAAAATAAATGGVGVLSKMWSLFGKKQENKKQLAETTESVTTNDIKVPGRVQSRINLEKNGWQHVLDRHFSGKNASQFSLSPDEVKSLLQEKSTVGTPVTKVLESVEGPRFVRNIDVGRVIGYDKFNNFSPTTNLTVMTDRAGNLVTAFPGAF